MATVGIDHIAMPTADAEALMEFYKRLGFSINNEAEWRAGTMPIFSIQVGDSKINVHPEGFTAGLRGPTAVPGCTDICFVWNGSVVDCQRMLEQAGVEIIEGPVPRAGGRERGRAPSNSSPRRHIGWMISSNPGRKPGASRPCCQGTPASRRKTSASLAIPSLMSCSDGSA